MLYFWLARPDKVLQSRCPTPSETFRKPYEHIIGSIGGLKNFFPSAHLHAFDMHVLSALIEIKTAPLMFALGIVFLVLWLLLSVNARWSVGFHGACLLCSPKVVDISVSDIAGDTGRFQRYVVFVFWLWVFMYYYDGTWSMR